MLRRKKKNPDIAVLLANPDLSVKDLEKVFATHDIILKALTLASTAAGMMFTVLQMANLLTDIRFVAFIPVTWFVIFIMAVQPTEEEKRKSALISKIAYGSVVAQLIYRGPAIAELIKSVGMALSDGKITADEAAMLLEKVKDVLRGEASEEAKHAVLNVLARYGITPEELAALATGGAAGVAVPAAEKKRKKEEINVK